MASKPCSSIKILSLLIYFKKFVIYILLSDFLIYGRPYLDLISGFAISSRLY